MRVTVEVLVSGPGRPPAGATVIVQVRDTSLQDAPAAVLAEARAAASGRGGSLATVELDLHTTCAKPTVWAHVDVDGDGRVSRGDFVTAQSYPLPRDPDPRLPVTVKSV